MHLVDRYLTFPSIVSEEKHKTSRAAFQKLFVQCLRSEVFKKMFDVYSKRLFKTFFIQWLQSLFENFYWPFVLSALEERFANWIFTSRAVILLLVVTDFNWWIFNHKFTFVEKLTNGTRKNSSPQRESYVQDRSPDHKWKVINACAFR